MKHQICSRERILGTYMSINFHTENVQGSDNPRCIIVKVSEWKFFFYEHWVNIRDTQGSYNPKYSQTFRAADPRYE